MTAPANTPIPPVVSVLADDLTGATDTVVQFREAGWPAYLLLSGGAPTPEGEDPTGVALARSLDTRPLSDSDAAAVTERAVAEQVAAGSEQLYLKVDSTLRGSVNGQIAGALSGWRQGLPEAVAVVCPAYPRMGRTVVEGRVLVHGVPLDQSEAGFDPVTPVRTAELAALIGGGVAVGTADSAAELADRIKVAAATGATRVIVDAADDADLERLTEAVALVGAAAVSVGSAGWARHLAAAWLTGAAQPTLTPSAAGPGPLVVCVTSLNEVALDQADHLATALAERVVRHQVLPAEVAGAQGAGDRVARVVGGREPDVVLLQPSLERIIGADQAAVAREIAQSLAATVAGFVDADRTAGLVLVGGDGAEATLASIGAEALQIDRQVSEGVPLGRVVGGRAAGLPVATKAGGFGGPTTLIDVVTAMLTTKETES